MPWKRQTFRMRVTQGSAEAAWMPVEGWTNHPFAIDERTYWKDERRKGWCITHLPTGYAARFILGPRALAMKIADALAKEADWSFIDPAEARDRSAAVKAVIAQFPGAFVPHGELGVARRAGEAGDAQ